ncbi:MAG TPA: class I SAM-dependent methyltransferase [Acidimicrobiales bacterium]|nr:class I SAM-dependent methyltransferase [Acidimicrobiales bacterium]
MTTAAQRWAEQLARWAIPEEIMAQAPESPWEFSPALFKGPPPEPGPETVSQRRAKEALPEGGSVLDVGCGGGAAGLALVPPAARVTGFDQSAELLAIFAERARELGVDYQVVQGDWPEGAASVGPADVVVCHHVAYNVPNLADFATALTSHARNRVVVELSDRHPRYGVNPLWRHFWDVERPEGPVADDAAAALREAGIEPHVERSPRRARSIPREARVASVRKYLCLPADRDPEIDALLGDDSGQPGEVVTMWWDVS